MQYRPVALAVKPFVPKQPTVVDIAALLYAESIVPSDNIPRRISAPDQWDVLHPKRYCLPGTQQRQQRCARGGFPHHYAANGSPHATDAHGIDEPRIPTWEHHLRQFKETQMLIRRTIVTDGVQQLREAASSVDSDSEPQQGRHEVLPRRS